MFLYSFTPHNGTEKIFPTYARRVRTQNRKLAYENIRLYAGAFVVPNQYNLTKYTDIYDREYSFVIFESDKTQLDIKAQEWVQIFNSYGQLKFRLSDGTERWAWFWPTSVEIKTDGYKLGYYEVNFSGTVSQYMYGTARTQTIPQGTSNVTTQGAVPIVSGLVIRVNRTAGSVSNISIQNNTNGCSFTWANSLSPLGAGEYLYIDCGGYIVFKSNLPNPVWPYPPTQLAYTNISTANYGDLFRLELGTNQIVLASNATANAQLSWYDTYLPM